MWNTDTTLGPLLGVVPYLGACYLDNIHSCLLPQSPEGGVTLDSLPGTAVWPQPGDRHPQVVAGCLAALAVARPHCHLSAKEAPFLGLGSLTATGFCVLVLV